MRRLAALTSQLPRYVNTATVWTVADRYQPATRTANPTGTRSSPTCCTP